MDPISPQPQVSQTTPMQAGATPEHKKVGPIIAVLVIVLVLIIGALYLFASRINQEQVPTDTSVASGNTVAAPQTVQPVTNKADDVSAIEADLNASSKGLDAQTF